MKMLFIGGTGLISSACSELAVERGHELFLLNRSVSEKYPVPQGATLLRGDVHARENDVARLLAGHHFDAVVDFIAYTLDDVERDLRLFRDIASQFVFISSASAYQKPPRHYLVTEETPLENPYWEYSRNKIACEQRLMQAYREQDFPVTIVRPSLTYGPSQIPLAVGSWLHPWTIPARIRRGAPVIVPGDGTSLWVVTWHADFATGLLGLLGKREAVGEAYQITSDEVLTWDEIYREVFGALGVEPNILHMPADIIVKHWPEAEGSLIGDKIYSLVFDNSKIKRLVPDFRCDVNWAQGVRRCIDWHRAHPQFQTVDQEMERMLDEMVGAFKRAEPGDA
jgi:nucleoside-diphosphate-sugar epimerase